MVEKAVFTGTGKGFGCSLGDDVRRPLGRPFPALRGTLNPDAAMIRDLSADRPKYREQGHVFTVRPTTAAVDAEVSKVWADYQAWHAELQGRIKRYGDDLAAWYKDGADEAKRPNVDDYVTDDDERREGSIYFDLFRVVTEGPHGALDPEHFDKKVAERVVYHYLPESRRRQLVVDGWLPVSVD